MIDKSKCHFWKPAKDLKLKDFTCSRCGHIMSMEDFAIFGVYCPFCGKKLNIQSHWSNEVEIETDIFPEEEVV